MKKLLMLVLTGLLSVALAVAQQVVTGTVTDSESGGPLEGASVIVKGTTLGVLTGSDGKYKLSMPRNSSVLIVSYVGKKTVEQAVSGSSLDVTMVNDAMQVDEVVVTALGIERDQKAIGYSAQTVGGSTLKGSAEVNVVQSLSQKVAGVQVFGSGGTPGASSKILIRGNTSFTGQNQPLFVIDGVPMDNTTSSTTAGDDPFNPYLEQVNYSNRALDINPDDIASVTVLKGPAAAALYGVRAANGAVVITTKRGGKAAGKSLNISFNTSFQRDEVNKLPEQQNTYAQGSNGGRFTGGGTLNPGTYSTANPGADMTWFTGDAGEAAGTPQSWGPKISTLTGAQAYDNPGTFFQTGTTLNNNLAISGGSDVTSFRLSMGRTDQTGIVPNTDLHRTSVRLTGETKLSDKITVFGTANYINTSTTLAQNGSNLSGVMLSLMRMPVTYDVAGSGYGDGYAYINGEQHLYFSSYDNPLWTAYNNPFTSNVNRILGNVSASYTPTSWMNITYRVGTDQYTDSRQQRYSIGSRATGGYEFKGEIRNNTQTHSENYADLLITLKRQFNNDIQGSLTLGNNLNQRDDKDFYERGRFLTIPGFFNMSNASVLYTSNTAQTIRSAALFYDANLSYKNLLYLNTTGRNEWSSTFTGANFFPSASASFVFSELIGADDILSFGKFRAAYSQGGANPDVYTSRTYFAQPLIADGFTNGFGFPYLGQGGFGYSSTLGNAALRPERTTGREIGFDLRFFQGRLNFDVSFYNQKTTDILVYRPLAGSTGFSYAASNSGSMENKGIEAVITGSPISTKDFVWDITINFTRNRNKVLSLAPGITELQPEAGFGDIASFAVVGQPYGVIYGTTWARDSATGKLLTEDGLPYTDGVNRPIGNPYPDWLAGIRNTFTYKGLSLTALLDIRQGGDVWGGTIARMNNVGTYIESGNRESTYVVDGVNADGTPNTTAIDPWTYHRIVQGDAGGARENAIFDASWVRLREVGISYPVKFKDEVPVIRSLTVGFIARNLWLKTNYPGVDPETSLTGAGSNIGGWDYFNMPGTRSYQLNLSLSF